jgi:hypothetical protein
VRYGVVSCCDYTSHAMTFDYFSISGSLVKGKRSDETGEFEINGEAYGNIIKFDIKLIRNMILTYPGT